MNLVRIIVDRHEVGVRSEDFDRCFDEIDVLGFIAVVFLILSLIILFEY